jgi:DNA-binding PadR family transcriptional regulator
MARKRATSGDIVERMLDEWKGGMLTFWVLGLLLQRPMYGLEIKKEIDESSQGKIHLGVSTIYQLLRRLEMRGMVTSRWEKNPQGPPRAYYEATTAGRTIVFRFIEEILSPLSPIPSALGRLMQQILASKAKPPEKES